MEGRGPRLIAQTGLLAGPTLIGATEAVSKMAELETTKAKSDLSESSGIGDLLGFRRPVGQ
jgi:hypothetical protein